MRALRINFVKKRHLPLGFWYAMWTPLVIVSAWQSFEIAKLLIRDREIQTRTEQLQTEFKQLQNQAAIRPTPHTPAPYFADATAIAQMAKFPYRQMFRSIESAQVLGVKVVTLEVNAAQGEARLELQFTQYEALHDYLKKINMACDTPLWDLRQAQRGVSGPSGLAGPINTASLAFRLRTEAALNDCFL